jgi:hypothetical protein
MLPAGAAISAGRDMVAEGCALTAPFRACSLISCRPDPAGGSGIHASFQGGPRRDNCA